MKIQARGISKKFGHFDALSNVDLEVPPGQLVALLGPSGSGKTTLLRVVAGLESSDQGEVLYGENNVTRLSARERNVGFVFQHYALFGHMTIFENIAFGLRVRKWKKEAIHDRVHELLKLIQLEGLAKRFPSQLSGGQRQRVALARSLAPEPQVLLLDEPFGALDAKVRLELRRWLRRLHDEIHMTSLFVTHDQEEAFEVADRVVVMNKGRIEQVGSPDEVFAKPANPFVMDFLGSVNVFHGRVQSGKAQVGAFKIPFPEHTSDEAREATAYVRPHELDIDRVPHGEASIKAKVLRVSRSGSLVKLVLEAESDKQHLEIELDHQRDRELNLAIDDEVFVYPYHVRVFVQEAGHVAQV